MVMAQSVKRVKHQKRAGGNIRSMASRIGSPQDISLRVFVAEKSRCRCGTILRRLRQTARGAWQKKERPNARRLGTTRVHVAGRDSEKVERKQVKMNADDVTNGVACTLKPPVFLHLGGEDAKTHTRCSGVCVIDVTLPPGKTVNIETIDFKNFYTALVSVRLQKRSPGQEGAAAEWRTALGDRPLMSNPHTEAGAQDYYSIHRNQEPDKELSDWLLALNLVDPDPHVPGPVDAASVSCSLQQMWALTQVMQSSQSSTTSVGRFDVDGCYDISLLSLT
ncbi:nicolin-1 isoform X2 [Phyllopteryx taeniolatus]|uniref:nicolin-1 isoform X2 n=1 Tax=Phyllopteryx taeniolatus TaxID=161469 RepID=UPI002AD2623B|nr:nicolin-1 isoform X2 [Phyllopteryx taeniolatus]